LQSFSKKTDCQVFQKKQIAKFKKNRLPSFSKKTDCQVFQKKLGTHFRTELPLKLYKFQFFFIHELDFA